MLPEVIKRSDHNENLYLFNTKYQAKVYRGSHLDLEKQKSLTGLDHSFNQFFQNLEVNTIARFKSISAGGVDFNIEGDEFFSRQRAINDLFQVKHDLFVSVEKKIPFRFRDLLKKEDPKLDDFEIRDLESLGLNLSTYEYSQNITENDTIRAAKCGLQINDRHIAILTLKRLGNYGISFEDLALMRGSLPYPHEIIFTARRLDEKEASLVLNMKSKQEKGGRDLVSQRKEYEAQRAIEESELFGKNIISFDLSIVLTGFNPDELLSTAYEAKRSLSFIGEFTVENLGAYECYKATRIGGGQHISHYELSDKVSAYLPVIVNGNQNMRSQNAHSFYFHRNDLSIDCLDPFSDQYDNYSGLVIGKSGRGKSVFVNNLVRCLNFDEDTRIILVDVKGSHTNTVKKLGGKNHLISSSEPCGISPFDFLRENRSKEVLELLSDFLEKLVLDNGEFQLLKEESSQINECLIEYLEDLPQHPSLDDFINKYEKKLPRINSFKNWTSRGLYGSIFFPHQDIGSDKLHYFNFKDIQTASNNGVGVAVMSAIMAHFNFILLNKKDHEKLIFIADETPFFVKNCFASFSLLVKNVRKLHGSLTLVSQNLSDLVVNGDASLVTQTEFKVLFSKDKGFDKFDSILELSESGSEKLDSFKTDKGKFSQFLLKDQIGERSCQLILTPEEYLRSTTHSDDKSKLADFRNLLSLKSDNKALEVMATIAEVHNVFL